jgi:hypothetical protein
MIGSPGGCWLRRNYEDTPQMLITLGSASLSIALWVMKLSRKVIASAPLLLRRMAEFDRRLAAALGKQPRRRKSPSTCKADNRLATSRIASP